MLRELTMPIHTFQPHTPSLKEYRPGRVPKKSIMHRYATLGHFSEINCVLPPLPAGKVLKKLPTRTSRFEDLGGSTGSIYLDATASPSLPLIGSTENGEQLWEKTQPKPARFTIAKSFYFSKRDLKPRCRITVWFTVASETLIPALCISIEDDFAWESINDWDDCTGNEPIFDGEVLRTASCFTVRNEETKASLLWRGLEDPTGKLLLRQNTFGDKTAMKDWERARMALFGGALSPFTNGGDSGVSVFRGEAAWKLSKPLFMDGLVVCNSRQVRFWPDGTSGEAGWKGC